jgi:putative endonuclease
MWIVYVIYSKEAKKFYIGETSDFKRRLQEHNQKRGNHFTAKQKGEWELVYKEELDTKKDALIREKQLKSFRGRESIKKLIIPL